MCFENELYVFLTALAIMSFGYAIGYVAGLREKDRDNDG